MTSTQGRERVRNEGSKRKSSVCDWRPLGASGCEADRVFKYSPHVGFWFAF